MINKLPYDILNIIYNLLDHYDKQNFIKSHNSLNIFISQYFDDVDKIIGDLKIDLKKYKYGCDNGCYNSMLTECINCKKIWCDRCAIDRGYMSYCSHCDCRSCKDCDIMIFVCCCRDMYCNKDKCNKELEVSDCGNKIHIGCECGCE
jgi:hypothetical protein